MMNDYFDARCVLLEVQAPKVQEPYCNRLIIISILP